MATEVNTWCDPYPLVTWMNSKNHRESELQVFATQVIDGKGYRIALPPDGQEGLMKTYCIGPVKVVDGKAVILEKPENRVTDTPLTSIPHTQDIDVQSFVTECLTDSTCHENVTPEKDSFVTTGRPKADLPVEDIMKLHREGNSSRNIVVLLGLNVSYRTVARVIEGQQVLV